MKIEKHLVSLKSRGHAHSSDFMKIFALFLEEETIAYKAYLLKAAKGKQKEETPLRFAHYTSVKTLHNILQSPESGFRLYDASAMNDPTEGSYLIGEIAKKHKWLKSYGDDTEAYICSFVAGYNEDIGDQAIYWRSYGKDGLGCSIQFYNIDDQTEDLLPITYETEQLQAHFEAFFEFGQEICQEFEGAQKKEFVTNFWKCFDSIRYLYKHRGHRGEQEYRYVVLGNSDKSNYETELVDGYNNSPVVMKRFVPTPDLCITRFFKSGTKIRIGPRVHNKEKVCQDLRKFAHEILKKSTHENELYVPAFEFSNIPYRNLK